MGRYQQNQMLNWENKKYFFTKYAQLWFSKAKIAKDWEKAVILPLRKEEFLSCVQD